ncbi:MAG TPA: methylenetetrahydrofolate reductase [NAD(P)H] [Treponema sp.]|nr:methylenetetrahydrofolate reductase [NAD(P)H] [Treponema sp.]
MKITDIASQKKLLVSMEVFPPKKQDALDSVVSAAQELTQLKPDFISITYGAGGTTKVNTLEISQKILSFGTPALSHLTCVGNTKESISSAIEQMKLHNIQNVLALRGDIPQGSTAEASLSPDLRHASDLIPLLKEAGFCVGAACYPEGHPESDDRLQDLENMKYKVDAGVDFLTTQMFFDNNMLYSYLYRLQSAGIHVPVFAGIMPVTNASQVSRMIKLSSAYVPAKLLAICDRFEKQPEAMYQAGIAYVTDQIIDLISNGIKGIHIYTMNKPKVARDILNNISAIREAVNASQEK